MMVIAPTPPWIIFLPVTAGADWGAFAWPGKAPADVLHFGLDAMAWLSIQGRSLISVQVSASPGLIVQATAYTMTNGVRTGVVLQLAGGQPSSNAVVQIVLMLDAGDSKQVQVRIPVAALPPADLVPAGVLPVANDNAAALIFAAIL